MIFEIKDSKFLNGFSSNDFSLIHFDFSNTFQKIDKNSDLSRLLIFFISNILRIYFNCYLLITQYCI